MAEKNKILNLFSELNKTHSAGDVANLIGNFFDTAASLQIFDNTISDANNLSEKINYQGKNTDPGISDRQTIGNQSEIVIPIDLHNGDYTAEIEIKNSDRIDPKTLEMILPVISIKLENIILNSKFTKNMNFNNAMKNIAKIIETQYELNFIIPIIGEILDTFIENHLIYIFLKNDERSELVWPKACLDQEICDTVSQIKTGKNVILNQTKKTGFFPMVSENHLIGCIATKSTEGAITGEEIYYLEELVKQAATTITRAKVYSEILQYATLDALTGFYNRRQLDQRIKQEISGAKRRKTPLCAIMTDIDYFKKVNDTYGHAAGDLVLQTVAKIMRSQLREYDIAARYGGEEFVILLPYTKENEAAMVAERLRESVKQQIINIENVNTKNKTKNISVTISLGICCYENGYKDGDLIMNADKALYQAKETGRDKVVIYNSAET